MAEPEQPNYGSYGNGNGSGSGGGGEFGPPVEDARPGEMPPGYPNQPPYGTGQWQYGTQTGYQQPYYYGGYGNPQTPGTNGLAVAAMVCGICGFLCLIPGLVGVILGAVSLPQIKRSGQAGRNMAIAGIVTGALWIVGCILLIVLSHISN